VSVTKFGRYEIRQEIGRGGMATVYLAYDPRFRRTVALKALPRQFTHDPMFRTRFEREAQTIAALEHPAIVPVHDFGEENGQPFIVMRYMSGGSLSDRLQKGGLNLPATAAILERVASALDRAHGLGVIHRDLKPGNILFDQYQDAYLADFGIVKLAEATAALTGSGLVGTPAYMSPEQVKGEEIDGRSDIYTLGVILYEMLSGSQPYEATTPMGVLFKHVHDPVPKILDKMKDLPPQLDTIISQAMAKNVNDRFQTAGELAATVTVVAQQQPDDAPATVVTSPPESEVTPPPTQEMERGIETEVSTRFRQEKADDKQDEPVVEAETSIVAPVAEESQAEPVPAEHLMPTEVLPPEESEKVMPVEVREKSFRLPKWAWGLVGVVILVSLLLVGRALIMPDSTPVSDTPDNDTVDTDEPEEGAFASAPSAGQSTSDFILGKWEEGFRVTDLGYKDRSWAVIMSQNSPYGRQTWQTLAEFPGDFIQTKWNEEFRVTSLAYGNGLWAVVMSQNSPYGRQTWQTLADFPGDFIQTKWNEGFRVTSLAYGNGLWAVVMSQNSLYGRQTWQTLADFPGDFIQTKWNEEFRATNLAYGDGLWAVIMSQNSPYGRQTWQTLADFPGDFIQAKWGEGFRVNSLAYGNGVWAVIMAQEAPYGRQTWLVTPDF
jgi:serine/threonine protein kinase